MNPLIGFLVLSFSPFVFSSGDSLLEPCERQDIECLSRATQQFLEKTCKGIPQYDIRPIDPLIIPSLKYEVDKDMGLVFKFRNLNVTGLRNQKISDFQMDLATKSVLLKTQADLNIVADITIELEKDSKTFSGVYYASASVLGTARYNYEIKEDAKGVKHFDVGPETLTCEAITEPTVTLDHALHEAILKDPATVMKAPAYTANKTNFRKQTFCKIVELAYVDVIHNIRASAKILSAENFIKNITI